MSAVPALFWSTDGSTLWHFDVSGRLFSVSTGQSSVRKPMHCSPSISALSFANGQVAVATKDGNLVAGPLGTRLSRIKVPGYVREVALDRTGDRFCAVADDRTKVWCGCVHTNCPDWTIEGEHATISPAWSSQSDCGLYLAVFESKRVTVYRNSTRTVQSRICLPSSPEVACWSPASPLLAIGQENGRVFILDAHRERAISTAVCDQAIEHLYWEGNGRRLLAASKTGTWLIVLTGSESEIRVERHRKVSHQMRCGAYRPESRVFAAGSEFGEVFLSRPACGVEPRLMYQAGTSIEAIAWSPSGKRLAIADVIGKIRVIRVCR